MTTNQDFSTSLLQFQRTQSQCREQIREEGSAHDVELKPHQLNSSYSIADRVTLLSLMVPFASRKATILLQANKAGSAER